MFIDAQTQLWNAAALTASAYSTNVLDIGAPYPGGTANGAAIDISAGEPLGLVLTVGVAADHTTGDETYSFEVVQAATSTISSSPDTLVAVAFTNAQAAALLFAGAVIVVPLPSGSVTKRYLGAHYTGGGTTPTITVSGSIMPLSMIQRQAYYASATVIE